MGMKSKFLSVLLSSAMVINVSPVGILKAYAEEKNITTQKEEYVKGVSTVNFAEKMEPTFEDVFEIRDKRKEAKIVIDESELTKAYNGQVQYPKATLVNSKTEEVIDNVEIKVEYPLLDNLGTALYTRGKDVGTYSFTATFAGNADYLKTKLKGRITITKGKANVKVSNSKKEYTGSEIKTDVTVSPKASYINVYTGMDLSLNGQVFVDLNLGEGYIANKIEEAIEKVNLGTIGDFKAVLETLNKFGIDVSGILKALEYIPNDLKLTLGAPINAGAYLSTVVTIDKNVNTAVGIGSLLIYRQNGDVVFTEDSLPNNSVVRYGDDYNFEAVYKDTNKKVKIMYSGVTVKGEGYFSDTKPTQPGAYIALAYSYDDPQYKAALAGRAFAISKDCAKVEITSELEKLYDKEAYEATSVVTDSKGNVIEGAKVKYTYFKGLKQLKSAPVEPGKYTVVAVYEGSGEYYKSVDIKCITIKESVKVIFDDIDDNNDKVKYVAKGEALDYVPEVLTKDGYTFVGWYENTDNITTEYKSGRKYNSDVTYTAKWAHVSMNKTVLKHLANGNKALTFGATIFNDENIDDEVVERGILVKKASSLAGEKLTLSTTGATKFVGKADIGDGLYYYGTITNIPAAGFKTRFASCTYVTYKDKSGNTYTVYSYGEEGGVSVNDLLN